MNFFDFKGGGFLKIILLITIIITLGIYSRFILTQTSTYGFGTVTISVQGEGEVYAVPDVGQFSFSVTEKGNNAEEAQSRSAEKTNKILATLKELEIEEKDIKTENYNLYPIYRYETGSCLTNNYYCPSKQILDGFEVSQTIVVKVRDLDKAGNVLAKVGEGEVSNISNLNFVVDDIEVSKKEAREKAIAKAKENARDLEKVLGVKFEKMVDFYESGFGPYAGYDDGMYQKQIFAEEMASDVASTPNIPAGENVIRSQVTLVYKVK